MVIALRLAIRIVAVLLMAGVSDKVFSAAHTSQYGALRKLVIHIDICRRSNIRHHIVGVFYEDIDSSLTTLSLNLYLM